MYKKALTAEPSPDQETWIQFQIVRLARGVKRPHLAASGLHSLSENRDSLVRRIATVLQREPLPAAQFSQQGGNR